MEEYRKWNWPWSLKPGEPRQEVREKKKRLGKCCQLPGLEALCFFPFFFSTRTQANTKPMPTLTILNWSCKTHSKIHGIKAQNSNEDPKPTTLPVTSILSDSLKSMLLWLNGGSGQSLWNQDAYLILKCLFMVPLSRQRLPSPAFPLCHSLVSGVREDLMLVQCSVSLHTDFGVTLIEVCFLKQTRLKI